MAFSTFPVSSAVQQQQQWSPLRYQNSFLGAFQGLKLLRPRANGLLGSLHPLLGPASAARAPSRIASERDSYKTNATVQQRHGVSTETAQHYGQQNNSHSHHVARPTSDDSLRIIMLLSLSLTLMLLPWISRHPEFLIAPALLAVTPVVGNGVRPVLKEAGSGLLTTLRLSLGLLAHHEQYHLPGGHHNHHGHTHNHHHTHHQHSSHSNHRHHHHQQQQQGASSPWPNPQQQQQQGASSPWPNPQQQQQQHPRPAGPYSPWPNPARSPASWPYVRTAAAAAAANNAQVQSSVSAAGTVGDGADSDWGPSSPPDPHHADPHSQQHLQQVLAADKQMEQELGRPEAAAAAASSSGGAMHVRSGSPNRSPSGSPVNSVDNAGLDQILAGNSVPAGAAAGAGAGASGHHQHHHHHHVRDPRVLSKEAKQQLYHNHQHHGQQQQQRQ